MLRISSNTTLFLKIFFPTFWIVFFGIFAGAVWMLDAPFFGPIPALWMKTGLSAFFLLGTTFLYFTFMVIKRVELDDLYIYASNYFKTFRYPYHNVEKITERDMMLFHIVHIHLKTPGNFGKKITFLLDEAMFKDCLSKHPEAAAQLSALHFELKK